MNTKLLAPIVALALATGWSSSALAQPESTFQLVAEIHIVPGQEAEFEALNKARNMRLADGNVSFPTRISVAEGLPLVYRSSSYGLENLAALDTRQAQIDAMPPASTPGAARGVIDHIESSIRRTRPDLNYAPDSPRVPVAEASFIREIDLYLRFGTAADAEDVVKQVMALYGRHNVQNQVFVTSAVTGNGPDLRFVSFGRDAADFYAENQRVTELLGGDLQSLLNQMRTLTRRVGYVNRFIRRDLNYQPSN